MKSKRGSSLIEIIIALSILMIIVNMLSVVFSFTTKGYGRLREYNERLNAVEFISKNILHNYSYEDVCNLMETDLTANKLVLDSKVVKDDINSLSMGEIVDNYRNNSTGDIEVSFELKNEKNEINIKIKCITYGASIKEYEIIKRGYDN